MAESRFSMFNLTANDIPEPVKPKFSKYEDKYFSSGMFDDLVIEGVEDKGPADKDPTWIKFVFTL
jgi:hypothetical protein